MKLILASSSPRRIELLKTLVADFEIKIPQDEEILDQTKSAEENTRRLATQKAREVYASGTLTLGFDTLGELDGIPFGKPRDKAAAVELLKKLSGKTHAVVSSFCAKRDDEEIIGSETAQVTFRELSEEEIESYVQNNPVESFAGGYAIQSEAKKFVEKVEGDVEVVIGFPVRSIKPLIAQM